jgi:hypothetical protein
MIGILEYFDRVSIFGPSALALLPILAANWASSAIHIYQEWKGAEVPLWRVFGAVVGVWIPNPLGFAIFTVGLLVVLWAVGLAGITGWFLVPLPLPVAVGTLGAVVGALVADSIISHWGLYSFGYRPNPGLSSTALYAAEAIFILMTFWKGFSLAPDAALIGFAKGLCFDNYPHGVGP